MQVQLVLTGFWRHAQAAFAPSLVSFVCKTMGGERKTLKKKIKVKKMQFDFSDPLAIFIPS